MFCCVDDQDRAPTFLAVSMNKQQGFVNRTRPVLPDIESSAGIQHCRNLVASTSSHLTTEENVAAEFDRLCEGEEASVFLAKNWIGPFGPSGLTQHPEDLATYDIFTMFNAIAKTYFNAFSVARALYANNQSLAASFLDGCMVMSGSRTALAAAIVDITRKEPIFYHDYQIGTPVVGAISQICRRCPRILSDVVWHGNDPDWMTISVPTYPTTAEIKMAEKKAGEEGSVHPVIDYQHKMFMAAVQIMTLPPIAILRAIAFGMGYRLFCSTNKMVADDMTTLLSSSSRINFCIAHYLGTKNHAFYIKHEEAFTLATAASRLFNRTTEYCSIYLRDATRVNSEYEFLAYLLSDVVRPPSDAHLRKAHDVRAVALHEYFRRGNLLSENPEVKKAVSAELCSSIAICGSTIHLANMIDQSRMIIDAERKCVCDGNGPPCMKERWATFRNDVRSLVRSETAANRPLFRNVSSSYLSWCETNFADGWPGGMACTDSTDGLGEDYVTYRKRYATNIATDPVLSSYMQSEGRFLLSIPERARALATTTLLYSRFYVPKMGDSLVWQNRMGALINPAKGYVLVSPSCENPYLSLADEMTLVVSRVLRVAGFDTNNPECTIAAVQVLYLTRVLDERLLISLFGDPASGKTTLMSMIARAINEMVRTSETEKAKSYAASRFGPELGDEWDRIPLSHDDIHSFIYDAYRRHFSDSFPNTLRDSALKSTTNPVQSRVSVNAQSKTTERATGSTTENMHGVRINLSIVPSNSLSSTNVYPHSAGKAVESRMLSIFIPERNEGRGSGLTSTQIRNPESRKLAYLEEMYPYFSLGVLFRCSGFDPRVPLSGLATVSAVGNAILHKGPSPLVGALRAKMEPQAPLDPLIVQYSALDTVLQKTGVAMHGDYLHKMAGSTASITRPFTQESVDAFSDACASCLTPAGVVLVDRGVSVATGRWDVLAAGDIDNRCLAEHIRAIVEYNMCGFSFDRCDLLKAYAYNELPSADSAYVLSVANPISMHPYMQPYSIDSARSLIALVMFALTRGQTVRVNSDGYIRLEGFFSLATSIDGVGSENAQSDTPRGNPPNSSDFTGVRYTPGRNDSAGDGFDANDDEGPRGRSKQTNRADAHLRKRLDMLNRFCVQRYSTPEISSDLMALGRWTLAHAQSADVPTYAPFLGSTGILDEEDCICIHAKLLVLPRLVSRAINSMIHIDRPVTCLIGGANTSTTSSDISLRDFKVATFYPRDLRADADYSPLSRILGAELHRPDIERIQKLLRVDEYKFDGVSSDWEDPFTLRLLEAETAALAEFPDFRVHEFESSVLGGMSDLQDMWTLFTSTGDHSTQTGDKQSLTREELKRAITVDESELAAPPVVEDGPSAATDAAAMAALTAAHSSQYIKLLRKITPLIAGADMKALRTTLVYIQHPERYVRELESDTKHDLQQCTAFRIASLVKRVASFPEFKAGTKQVLHNMVTQRLAALATFADKYTGFLRPYLSRVESFCEYTSSTKLSAFEVDEKGDLKTVDQGARRYESLRDSLDVKDDVYAGHEPVYYADKGLRRLLVSKAGKGGNDVYSRANGIGPGFLLSLREIDNEIAAIRQRMLGRENVDIHWTSREFQLKVRESCSAIFECIQRLAPLLALSSTMGLVLHSELCCHSAANLQLPTTASVFRGLMRSALLHFHALMYHFTQAVDLQVPFIDEGFCVYWATKLKMHWMRRPVVFIASVLYSGTLNFEKEKVIAFIDPWISERFVVTPAERVAFLARNPISAEWDPLLRKVNLDVDTSRLIFYPKPGDALPDSEEIQQKYMPSREEFKLDVVSQHRSSSDQDMQTRGVFSRLIGPPRGLTSSSRGLESSRNGANRPASSQSDENGESDFRAFPLQSKHPPQPARLQARASSTPTDTDESVPRRVSPWIGTHRSLNGGRQEKRALEDTSGLPAGDEATRKTGRVHADNEGCESSNGNRPVDQALPVTVPSVPALSGPVTCFGDDDEPFV